MSTGLDARRALCGAVWGLSVCCAMPAWSDEPGAELSQVIVTASRVPEPVSDTFWSTTVITQTDIQARQVQSMTDLLADLAGVNIDRAGGLGQQSSVFIRGADSDHTLLLIDGVRVGSATLGSAPFEIIPLGQIDHIEVVRGPRSTLYGSDAIGGVIQIFTRHATDPGVNFGGSVMDGSYDTHEFAANLSARGAAAWVSLSGDVLTTGGIPSCLPGALTAGAACFEDHPNPLPNGFQNRSASLTTGIKVTDQLTAQVDELFTTGWTAFDGDFDNNLHFTENVTTLHLDEAFSPGWHLRFLAGRDIDDEHDFLNLTSAGIFDSTRNSASLQIDGQASRALRVLGGIDYEQVKVDSDTSYIITSRTVRALFSELRGEFGAWSALAGARLEDNSQFGDHVTGNAGLMRKLGGSARLTFTWGTAFRAPTFDELYFPGFGNPRLKPEQSQSFEAGVDGASGALHWSLHAYQTRINNEIGIDPTTFLPVNIDQARIRGVELQADWHDSAWGVGGQLTGMEPLNLSPGPDYDNLLNRRANQNAAFTVRRFLSAPVLGGANGSVGVVSLWQGRRYDDLANTLRMGGYLRVDLLTQWSLTGGWSLEARIANLFDRSYQTAAYYAQPGRNYGVTVRYQSQAK
jgi:vitamin B12 transporter